MKVEVVQTANKNSIVIKITTLVRLAEAINLCLFLKKFVICINFMFSVLKHVLISFSNAYPVAFSWLFPLLIRCSFPLSHLNFINQQKSHFSAWLLFSTKWLQMRGSQLHVNLRCSQSPEGSFSEGADLHLVTRLINGRTSDYCGQIRICIEEA